MQLEEILVCPCCKGSLIHRAQSLYCQKCRKDFPNTSGITNFTAGKVSRVLNKSQFEYDKIHEQPWDQLKDGSYEILAAFARGNKTLDIACGDGYIEELAPHTVGLDFSLNALLKAKKRSARYLVQATAEELPFPDDSFDLTICAGSLEHFTNPQKAVSEMVRVSQIQLLTVHQSIPGHQLFSRLLRVAHQPIERPLLTSRVVALLKKAHAQVIFKGVWTLPVNYGRVIKWIPVLSFLPSSSFVISIKKS